jgi:hypothetical protein
MKPGHDKIGSEYFYPLGDQPTLAESRALGVADGDRPRVMASIALTTGNIKAIWTGEKRTPRAGEWYLSGAIIAAYKAKGDLTTVFHIARLVTVSQETTFKVQG